MKRQLQFCHFINNECRAWNEAVRNLLARTSLTPDCGGSTSGHKLPQFHLPGQKPPGIFLHSTLG